MTAKTFNRAANASLIASIYALDHSDTIDKYKLAMAVGMEAGLREVEAEKLKPQPKVMQLKKPSNLGCWVDGKLRFQSRDHDNVHAYAKGQMQDKRNTSVWVAPVGSFVDA